MTTRKGEDNAIQKKEKETMPNLADRSREIRTQLGLSQNDVAKALHVTRGFISNVENGRVNMSMRLMVYYAQLMHVSLDEIAGLTDKQYLSTALDNEIMEEVSQLSLEEKNDLLNHLRSNRKARKKTEESKVEPVS
jgi:transcriptional regulator with XRE-family HTH domain